MNDGEPINLADLSPERRALLLRWLERDGGLPRPSSVQRRPPGMTSLPLSFAQHRLWLVEQLDPGSGLYNTPLAMRIRGRLDAGALERAFNRLVIRHESLRTRFALENGEPVQVVESPGDIQLPVVGLNHLSDSELRTYIAAELQRPFDLVAGPLVRTVLLSVGHNEHVWLLTMHHIICDGWSIGVLTRELSALYSAEVTGEAADLPDLPVQYADYAVWQKERLQGDALVQQLDYWKRHLAGSLSVLQLPVDRQRPAVMRYRGATHWFMLPKELQEGLKAVARREGATLFMTLLAAYQVLLKRYTGQDDVVVGTPVAGRTQTEIENLVGFFINTLAMRTDLSGNPSFREVLARVRAATTGAYANQELPFEKLVEVLQPERSLGHTPIFQAFFVLQNTEGARLSLPEAEATPVPVEHSHSKFDLTLGMAETENGLACAFEYNSDLFNGATIERMAGHLQILLEGAVSEPEAAIDALPLLTGAEREQILCTWNETQVQYLIDRPLHQWVEDQVERTPDAVALVFEGESLTYRELNCRANQLANHLRARGVGPDVPVGILMMRSFELVIGLLGILKAGGAYVPLDPEYPTDRLAYILEDSQVFMLLTHADLADRLSHYTVQLLQLDVDWPLMTAESRENLPNLTSPDGLAYIIYTSGSTGRPKGVMVQHRGVCNRLIWLQRVNPLSPEDRILQKTPFSFDVSVWEFFWPLMTGARLVIARPAGHQDPAYLVRLLRAERITTVHFVPSMLQIFLEEPGLEELSALRQVLCSGEALPYDATKRFFRRIKARLHNLYGPTEASIEVTHWECKPGDDRRTVPIGRPIANTQLYVLDQHLEPVPVGVGGELHIGGVQVALGYLNRPELTAERFIANPFGPGRLYKTGDLCRYLPDGNIEYLGRLDNQVKIRGLRIELGEIEALLAQHPGVRDVLVLAREDRVGDKRLVAYLVAAAGQAPSAASLGSFLRARLPEYMVPAAFVALDTFPVNANGKVERKALPTPEWQSHEAFVAPATPLQEVVAALWADVLDLDEVGLHDNFFAIGGHSLLVIRLVARLAELFAIRIPVRTVFQAPTVYDLCEVLLSSPDCAHIADQASRILQELEQPIMVDVPTETD